LSFDNTCKYLAEQYPDDYVSWLLTDKQEVVEVLKTELTIEPIRADSVSFLQTTKQIVHMEFQTLPKSDPPIPLRELDYYVRLKRQYRCEIKQFVIFLRQTSDAMAFTEQYIDTSTTHHYRVIRLWEEDSTLFLNNPALLPLAPLTKTNSPQTLLSQIAERIAKIPQGSERQNIAGCTEILAGLRFEKDFIHQFLREDMMQESVIYQDILLKGEKREAFKWVTKLLNRKLGELHSSLIERIQGLSIQQLEELGDILFDFNTKNDLILWLNQQEN
jgi:predicted transposase YdaD